MPGLIDEPDELDSRARARVGTVLHEKWRLERLLGIGGMAAVYAARHRNGACAAVKVLHTHLARYKEVRERFQREGYVSNRVAHPGAVKVLDDDVVSGGPDAGAAYIVMELLDGESLDERMDRPPAIGEVEFLRIAGSVLEVLRAAHARGVVHRDLKPENLFLEREPAGGPGAARVKVLDFGMARLLQGQAITSYGVALGTPSFMSPEQAAGHNDEIDGRTDLFALGATGFRIRTGVRIHEGESAIDLVGKMARLPAPRVRSVAPDVSAPFARVIDRALEFRREDRYESADIMLGDVKRAIVELEPGATQGSSSLAPSSEMQSQGPPTIVLATGDLEPWPGGSSGARPSRQRRRVWFIVALAIVLMSAAGSAKFLFDWKLPIRAWPWPAQRPIRGADIAAGDANAVREDPNVPDAGREASPPPVDASPPPAARESNAHPRPAPNNAKPMPVPRQARPLHPKPATRPK